MFFLNRKTRHALCRACDTTATRGLTGTDAGVSASLPSTHLPGPAPLGDRKAASRGGSEASFLQRLRDSNPLVAAARSRGEVSDAELREEQRKASAKAGREPLRRFDRRDKEQNPKIWEADLPERINLPPNWAAFFGKCAELMRRASDGDPSPRAIEDFFQALKDIYDAQGCGYLRATYERIAGYAKMCRSLVAELLSIALGEGVLLKMKSLKRDPATGEVWQAANAYVICIPEFFAEEEPGEPVKCEPAADELTPERHFDPEPPKPTHRVPSNERIRRRVPSGAAYWAWAAPILAALFGLQPRPFGLNVYPLRPRPP